MSKKQKTETLQKSAFFKTPEELQGKISSYIKQCSTLNKKDEEGNIICDKYGAPIDFSKKATISGLAYFLGFKDRQSLYDYEKKGDEFACILSRARLFVEMDYEEDLRTPGINPNGPKFALMQMGWTEKQSDDSEAIEKLDKILSGIDGQMKQ